MAKIIAGPCQHESLEQSLEIARHCAAICSKYGADYIFKASYDKANRSSIKGERGVGLESTMNDFLDLKQRGYKLLTDVHEVSQVDYIEDIVDVIQIPAFLCRQTDLIQRACKTDCIVNIKKGQWMNPQNMVKGIDKLKNTNIYFVAMEDNNETIFHNGNDWYYYELIEYWLEQEYITKEDLDTLCLVEQWTADFLTLSATETVIPDTSYTIPS